MARFVLTRLLQSLAALAILSVVVFVLARATGDPLHLILPMSATEEDYAAEYLDLILSLKVVDSLEEALSHIQRFGSQHTEAIVTNDLAAARRFTAAVDAAAVLVNASTRFHDGFELGLGAEIGISTDKLHARGPCGLLELCSYKYVIWGEGQVRGS